MSSKRITIVVGIIIIGIFGYIGYSDAVRTWNDLQEQEIQIEQLNTQYEELDIKLDETIETNEKTQEELEQLEKEKQELEEERQRLEQELQAKVERETRLAEASRKVINAATGTQVASAVSAPQPQGNCGDNNYAAYIYGRESGGRVPGNCDVNAVNAGGCRGIGQACPGSKLPCGADYACQNKWFTNYAMERYGSWEAAYAFHLANGWW